MMDKGRPWPHLSVCTSSSHDVQTLREQFADSHSGEDPAPWQIRRILSGILASDSILAILPLQDWLALSAKLRNSDPKAERINQPADPNHHWRWRLHIPLEEMSADAPLSTEVCSLIKDSNRFNY